MSTPTAELSQRRDDRRVRYFARFTSWYAAAWRGPGDRQVPGLEPRVGAVAQNSTRAPDRAATVVTYDAFEIGLMRVRAYLPCMEAQRLGWPCCPTIADERGLHARRLRFCICWRASTAYVAISLPRRITRSQATRTVQRVYHVSNRVSLELSRGPRG